MVQTQSAIITLLSCAQRKYREGFCTFRCNPVRNPQQFLSGMLNPTLLFIELCNPQKLAGHQQLLQISHGESRILKLSSS